MARQEKRSGESFESLMRRFKKRVKEDGLVREYRDREFFKKPSEKRKEQKRSAARRTYLQQKADEL